MKLILIILVVIGFLLVSGCVPPTNGYSEEKELDTTPLNNKALILENKCRPDWKCSNWTECSIEGDRTRRCQDNNNCGTSSSKPHLKEGCKPSVELIKENLIEISYDELFRNNEKYVGKYIKFTGQVIQVLEEGNQKYELRIDTRLSYFGYSEDVIYAHYSGIRLREGDIIEFFGSVSGMVTYESLLGSKITIPEIYIVNLDLKTKAGDY